MPKKRLARIAGFGGFGGWKGVNKQGSPATINPNQFRDLENVTWSGEGGAIRERGGQSKLFPTPFANLLVNGIFDSSMGGGFVGGTSGGAGSGTMLPTGGGDGGGDPPTGWGGLRFYWSGADGGPPETQDMHQHVLYYDDERAGEDFQPHTFKISNVSVMGGDATGARPYWPITHDGKIYFGQRSHASIGPTLYSMPTGENGLSKVCDLPWVNASYKFTGKASWRGKLYTVLSVSAAQAPIVYEYDGTTLRQFNLTGLPAQQGSGIDLQLCPYGVERLILAYGDGISANQSLRSMTPSGVVSTITLPGAATGFSCGVGGKGLSWAEYKGNLYISGQTVAGGPLYTSVILKIDTAGVCTVARSFGTGGSEICESLAVFNGYLYYYQIGTVVNQLGRYDGTTFVDNHRTFVTANGDYDYLKLIPYKDCLVVLGNTAKISNGTDTTTFTNIMGDDTVPTSPPVPSWRRLTWEAVLA